MDVVTGQLQGAQQRRYEESKEEGNRHFRTGALQEALRCYNQAEQLNPLSAVPVANRAAVRIKLEDWQGARADAAVAIELLQQEMRDVVVDDDASSTTDVVVNNKKNHSVLLLETKKNLLVKILLRRAVACNHLKLYPLVKDDLTHVLTIQPNHPVAEQMLQELHATASSSLLPSPSPSPSPSSAAKTTPVRVVSSSTTTTSTAVDTALVKKGRQDKQPQREGSGNDMLSLSMENKQTMWKKVSQTCPRSGVEFEHAWRTLGNNATLQATLLVDTMETKILSEGLLDDQLTAELLMEIVNVLFVRVEQSSSSSSSSSNVDAMKVANVLLALAESCRFDLVLLFLGDCDHQSVHLLIDRLTIAAVPPHIVDKLREMYRV